MSKASNTGVVEGERRTLSDSAALQSATTDPIENAFRMRTLVLLLPAIIAMYGVYQGIQQVLLPAQVEAIDAASKVNNLAMLAVVSSVAGTIALPLGGAFSDKTHSKWGRRTPWLVGMSIASAGLAAAMGYANTILLLALAYGALWFTMNFYQGVIYAIIPDRVPERLRGTASSVVGLGLPLGVLIAVNVVSRTTQQMGYILIAIGLLITTLMLVVGDREPSSLSLAAADSLDSAEKSSGEEAKNRGFLSFFSAFKSRDFSLVFLSRIAFFFGSFAVTSYVFYIVTDYIGMDAVPSSTPQIAVSTLATITTVSQVIAVLVIGWVADKFNRRKLIVGLSALGMGVAFLFPLLMPNWTGMLIYAAVVGASTGIYFTVDLALMSLVLPNKGDEGRDLGLLAIATSVPSAFAPVVSAALINSTGTYASLFVFGIIAAVIGAISVFPVRSVQ